jgi:tetratricopeptide (TPR) repeat protein
MKALKLFAFSMTVSSSITVVFAAVPIIVDAPAHRRAAVKPFKAAEEQLEKGDLIAAKRNVDVALQIDPEFWPALYTRAKIFAKQGKYELAIQDCNRALRQYRGFVEAALLRAGMNANLRKYAEALKELNYVISLHPASVRLARALRDRAWFQATCPDASFRNGKQAIKDAKAACSLMIWKDENTIDTLAAACAEIGDFDSAVQYAEQALAVKDISSTNSKMIQRHLQSFQEHNPIRL